MKNREKKEQYFEQIKEMMREAGCKCLEPEHRSSREPWRFLCSCGNEGEQTPSDFKRGRRCQTCSSKNRSKAHRLSEEEVRKRFEGLPETFVRSYFVEKNAKSKNRGRTMVEYICKNGHTVHQLAYSFGAGTRCYECRLLEARKRFSLGKNSVSEELESMGMEFLDDEYINIDLPFRYRCVCGKKALGYLSALRKGVRCGCQRKAGEDSPHWNHDLTLEERETRRLYEEYKQWVKDVYTRDDYTCQKCNSRGARLHVHHIYAYSKHRDRRVDIKNGITLCECCHIDFHWEYGYNDFTPQDFYNYMEW